MGLQIADAAALLAAGAADHLVEQLERAFGSARIAIAKPEIGIDHTDQVQAREMMPLRHQLRADDDIDAALGNLGQLRAHGLDRRDQVAGQHHAARLGKQRRGLLLQPLDPGADGGQRVLGAAMRALLRPRRRESAMMADQALAKTVIDQPGVADVAGESMAAGAA